MARSQDLNSAGSQFFIVLKDANFLDSQYTLFGRVTAGTDAIDKTVALGRERLDGRTSLSTQSRQGWSK